MKRIFLDNAGTTQPDEEVLSAVTKHLISSYGNPSSTHQIGRDAKGIIEQCRKDISVILGCNSSELYFTSGATESNNLAITKMVEDLSISTIITSPLEHHAVLYVCQHLERLGKAKVKYVNILSDGKIDLKHLEELCEKNPNALVSLMHANNETGIITDIQEVGNIAKAYFCKFHSDTVQTIGHLPIDLKSLKTDAIVGSAHKFHGLKGTGFLYLNTEIKTMLSPLIIGGGQEKGLRAGTENVAGIVAMTEALKIVRRDLDQNEAHLKLLKAYFVELLHQEIPTASINGISSDKNSLHNIINIALPPSDKNTLLLFQLDLEGICVSGGSACSSGASIGSHVLKAMNVSGDQGVIRFSFSKYTTREEIKETISKLKAAIN